jgi:hypothetical protein
MTPTFYVLPCHVRQALGLTDMTELDLPRCGLGFDADALVRSTRYLEVIRERDAIRMRLATHRYNWERDVNPSRLIRDPEKPEPVWRLRYTPEERKADLERRRKRREIRRQARRAAAASI